MIVRDEEASLARCLASFAEHVDELVVVDTGSTDRTIEIAESFGARVVRWAWRDDFAAARNVSLDAATGDWCVLVDADDVFPDGEAAKLRRAAEKLDARGIDIGAIEKHEATCPDDAPADVVSGAARCGDPNWVVMLTRRAPHLRYRGIVHESLEPAMREAGGRGGVFRVRVVHYGAIQAVRDALGKDARNEALLRRRLATDPDDVEAAGYLAVALAAVHRIDEARDVVEAAWPALTMHATGCARLAIARAMLQTLADDWLGVLDTADTAVILGATHPDLDFMRADAFAALGMHADAALAFAIVTARRGSVVSQTLIPGAREWRASLGRARSLFLLRRHTEALAAYDDAISHGAPDVAAERECCAVACDTAA